MANGVSRAFGSALKKAELPSHFTPYSLRHTFASLPIQMSKSPAYVQRMLGHANYGLIMDLYGKWLPMGVPTAVNELDDHKANSMAI